MVMQIKLIVVVVVATNADCRLADWQINIVLKCSNPSPNPTGDH